MLQRIKIFHILKIAVNIVIICFLILLFHHFVHEQILLKRYIKKIETETQISKPYHTEDIILIRDFVNDNITHMQSDLVEQRPQIGWTVRKILINQQGLCGEGTRLLFHILRQGGVKSRRFYLHGNQCLHVILEYKNSNENWVLLEAINGPGEEWRTALNNSFTVDSLFNFGPYRYHVTPKKFLENYCYRNFSYSPLNGMLNNKFFKTEIYVHRPAPSIINFLMETHELFLFLFFTAFLVFYNFKVIFKFFNNVFIKKRV